MFSSLHSLYGLQSMSSGRTRLKRGQVVSLRYLDSNSQILLY